MNLRIELRSNIMKMENEKERKICKETVKASNLGKHKKRIVNLFVRGQQRE